MVRVSSKPMLDTMYEHALREELFDGAVIAGVDEVGRGPLAGPVMAAAVILPTSASLRAALASVVRDSKVMSARARASAVEVIVEHCKVSVGQASVAEIDALNIRQATFLAMRRALAGLQTKVDGVLVDGRDLIPDISARQKAIIKGDGCELSVGCASVIAKQTRDALMEKLALEHPMYGWAGNAGYGTAEHLAALQLYGACEHHRASFAPVKACLQTFKKVS